MKILLVISALSAYLPLIICNRFIPQIKMITTGLRHTDGPFWSNEQLFFVGPLGHNLCSYRANDGRIFCATIGSGYISFAAAVHNIPHLFVVSYDKKLVLLTWNSHRNAPSPHYEIIKDAHGVPVGENEIHEDRMTFGSIDPHGRLWFGTMNSQGPPHGNVWSYNPNFAPHLVQQLNKPRLRPHSHEGNNYSNGMVWVIKAEQPTRVYYNDALTNRIQMYDYDLVNGVLERFVETVFDLNDFHRYGINGTLCRIGRFTSDFRGWLWVPLIGGSGILEIDPFEKQVKRFIPIPAHDVSACAFGHFSGDTLYVTTIGHGPRQKGPNADQGGEIFSITRLGLGVFGTHRRAFLLNRTQTT